MGPVTSSDSHHHHRHLDFQHRHAVKQYLARSHENVADTLSDPSLRPTSEDGLFGRSNHLRREYTDNLNRQNSIQHSQDRSNPDAQADRARMNEKEYSVYHASGKPTMSVAELRMNNRPSGTSAGEEHILSIGTAHDAPGDSGPTSPKKPKMTRIHQACINCGLKKQKCTGDNPCAPCSQAGIDCEYRESKKRGPPKGTKRVKKPSMPSATPDIGNGNSDRIQENTLSGDNISADFGSSTQISERRVQPTSSPSDRSFSSTFQTTNSFPPTTSAVSPTFVQSVQNIHSGSPEFNALQLLHSKRGSPSHSGLSLMREHGSGSGPSMVNLQPGSHANSNSIGDTSRNQHAISSSSQHSYPEDRLAAQRHTSNFSGFNSASTTASPGFEGLHSGGFYRSPNSLIPQHQQPPNRSHLSSLDAHRIYPPSTDIGGSTSPQPTNGTPQGSFNRQQRSNRYHSNNGTMSEIEEEKLLGGGDPEEGGMFLEQSRRVSTNYKYTESRERDRESYRDRGKLSEHYRGATSGIPSLHARRTHSEEHVNGRTDHDEGADHESSRDASVLGKRARSDSRSNNLQHDLHKSPLSTSSTVSVGNSIASGRNGLDLLISDARHRSTTSLSAATNPAAAAKRDVQTMVDHIDQFTLPPIRLPGNSSSNGNGTSLFNSFGFVNGGTTGDLALQIPKGLFDKLIEYYFAISHHSCPIIYKPDVDIPNIQHQLPQLLLDGICCLAVRFLENRDLVASFPQLAGVSSDQLRLAREELEQHYYDRARRQMQDDDYRSDIATVQTLLLLSKRDNGCGRMLHCWQLVGSATRMVIDLGLHRKAAIMSKGKEITYGEIETRRRVFWQTYIMDKHAAASLGRPVFLREEDIDVLLPSEVAADEFDRWAGTYPFSQPSQPPPENRAISTHNAFARLSIILQREYMCYVVLRELYGQLCAWRNALPTHLQWTPGSAVPPPLPHQLLLHAFYNTCLLLVFRPVVPVSNQIAFPDQHQIPRPHDVCTRAADTIMSIMDVYEQSYGLQKVPSSTAVYYIFTAATIYVGNSSSANPKVADQANTNLDKCIKLLDHLSEACCAASQHRQILLDITSLGSTKLKSRDDAEDLLSSRVPSQTLPSSAKAPVSSTAPGSNASSRPITASIPAMSSETGPSGTTSTQPTSTDGTQEQHRSPKPLNNIPSQNNSTSLSASSSMQNSFHPFIPEQLRLLSSNTEQASSPVPGTAHQSRTHEQSLQSGHRELQHQLQPPIQSTSQSITPQQPLSQTSSIFPFADTSTLHQQNLPLYTATNDLTSSNNPFLSNAPTPQALDASFYAQFSQPSPFDASFVLGAQNNNSIAAANQADLAFWREMPIGCADPGDWNIFTDSYAQQLMTAIPQLAYSNDSPHVE